MLAADTERFETVSKLMVFKADVDFRNEVVALSAKTATLIVWFSWDISC